MSTDKGSSKLQEKLFRYYYDKVLALMRAAARTARKKEDLCQELDILEKTISGLGGYQLSKEQKQALKALVQEAKREAGCR